MMPARRPPLADLAGSADELERQFYDALRQGDVERLMALWSDDEEISCVHPGGARLVGALAIRASFDALFAHGGILAEPQHVRRVLTHDAAVHSVVERLSRGTGSAVQTGWVVATNVYVKTGLGWRMVAHHASPGSPDDLPEVVDTGATLH